MDWTLVYGGRVAYHRMRGNSAPRRHVLASSGIGSLLRCDRIPIFVQKANESPAT